MSTATTVTLPAATLAAALKAAASIVETRNTIPILANLRLFADGSTLTVTATDLDIELRQAIPLDHPAQLATTVDARRIADIVGAVDKGAQVTLAPEGEKAHRLVVKAGRSRWVLPTLPVDDFPVMAGERPGHGVTLPGKDLAAAFARVAGSISTEETRYYLNGVFLDPEAGKLRLTATNGHVLTCVTTAIDWPADAPPVIVPRKAARTIERLCADAGPVDLHWSDRRLHLGFGAVEIIGKTIDGSFPDYRRVIPAPQPEPVLFDPEILRAAIHRAALVATEKTRAVKITSTNGKLTVETTSPEYGTGSEEVPAGGGTISETGFNSQYLRDMLAAIGGETVELHHENAGAPALLRRAVDDGALGVVMPIRI